MSRVALLINHVLAAEPQATTRLARHAHKVLKIELENSPAWWPFATFERWRISPAGLVEWLDASSAAPQASDDLAVRLSFDRLRPDVVRAALEGQGIDALSLRLDGDAALAADVDWVTRECGWDIEADLAKLIGPIAARQVVTLARSARAALQKAVASRAFAPAAAAASDSQPPASAA
jgi:ubiquinone biosynthesis accessory factor UbiJ